MALMFELAHSMFNCQTVWVGVVLLWRRSHEIYMKTDEWKHDNGPQHNRQSYRSQITNEWKTENSYVTVRWHRWNTTPTWQHCSQTHGMETVHLPWVACSGSQVWLSSRGSGHSQLGWGTLPEGLPAQWSRSSSSLGLHSSAAAAVTQRYRCHKVLQINMDMRVEIHKLLS